MCHPCSLRTLLSPCVGHIPSCTHFPVSPPLHSGDSPCPRLVLPALRAAPGTPSAHDAPCPVCVQCPRLLQLQKILHAGGHACVPSPPGDALRVPASRSRGQLLRTRAADGQQHRPPRSPSEQKGAPWRTQDFSRPGVSGTSRAVCQSAADARGHVSRWLPTGDTDPGEAANRGRFPRASMAPHAHRLLCKAHWHEVTGLDEITCSRVRGSVLSCWNGPAAGWRASLGRGARAREPQAVGAIAANQNEHRARATQGTCRRTGRYTRH